MNLPAKCQQMSSGVPEFMAKNTLGAFVASKRTPSVWEKFSKSALPSLLIEMAQKYTEVQMS